MLQAEQDILVLLAQKGDRQAMALLYKVIQPDMLRFANHLCHDPQLARDLTHDVWAASYKQINKLRDPRVFKSWLLRAVKWRVFDWQKRRGQADEPITEMADRPVPNDDFMRLIKPLAPSEQQALYLLYVAELQVSEIALVQEVPVGTVKSRLNRARKRIKQTLENDDEYR